MILKSFKPITPSKRHLVKHTFENLIKKPLLKTRIKGKKTNSGRSKQGTITVRHIGGGHKKRYREITLKRNSLFEGIVCGIEYDPNRTVNVASVFNFEKGNFFYFLAPENLKYGDIVKTGEKAEIKIGHSLPLSEIPIGVQIHNVSKSNCTEGIFSRAAGAFSLIKEKTLSKASLCLMSNKNIQVPVSSFATIGILSNKENILTKLGKAGNSRWLNIRPCVRGVAMNPVDHPHGGGEGKKSGHNKTPWGKKQKKIKMSRSKWKGPYIANHIDDKIKSRCAEIVPSNIGETMQVHNGVKKKEFLVTKDMVGHKFGEFFFSRTANSVKKKKLKKKK
jgi:large subunit ribosomal protein L2